MVWASSLITLFLLISIISALLLAFFIYLSPSQNRALRYFSILLYSVLFWCFGYLFELVGTTYEVKLFWLRVEYVGITFTPLCFFLFAYHYGNAEDKPLRTSILGAIAVIPLLTYLAVLTNDYHQLIWQEALFVEDGDFLPLLLSRGTGFWVHVYYSYVLILFSYGFMIYRSLRSGTLGNVQTMILLGASSFPFIFNILNQIPIYLLPPYNLSPAAFGLSTVTIGLAVFRYHLLDLRPFARRAVLNSMTDGVIVLDPKEVIVDVNATGAYLLGDEPAVLINQTAVILPQPFQQAIRSVTHQQPDNFLYSTRIDDKKLYYQTTVSTLGEQTAVPLGHLIILRNVTEKVEQEERLRKSEEQYRIVSDLTSDFIFSFQHDPNDNQYKAAFFTDAVARVLGYPAAQFRTLADWQKILRQSPDLALLKERTKNLAGGGTAVHEFRLHHREGHIVWVRSFTRTIVDQESNQLKTIYAAVTDITTKKVAQKNQEALQQAMLSISTTLDYQAVLTKIAANLCQFLSMTSVYINVYLETKERAMVVAEYYSEEANELEKVSDLNVIYDSDLVFPFSVDKNAHQQARLFHGSKLPPDDPERKHLEAFGGETVLSIPIVYKGEIVAFADLWDSRSVRQFSKEEIDLARAIAQQSGPAIENARLFEQTQIEHARLQSIIETIHDGILVIGSNPQLSILVFNDRARQLLRVTGPAHQWVDRSIISLLRHMRSIAPAAVSTAVSEIRRFFSTDLAAGEGQFKIQDSSIIWRNVPVVDGNEEIGRLIVLRDVTEEQKLQKMQDDLIGTMVHDLRNPLAIAQAALQGTRLLNDASLPETTAENLTLADKSLNHALQLVSDILDISRLESGRFHLNYALFRIDDLISELRYTQKPLLTAKNIELTTILEEKLPLLWADWQLISRVLQNLLDNAIKFTPERGEIRIRTCRIENGRVQVEITDSGSGIPPAIAPQLFQKFAPGPQSGSGTGLGLAFCRMVLEAHNEKIWVAQTNAAGTTFAFTLSSAPSYLLE